MVSHAPLLDSGSYRGRRETWGDESEVIESHSKQQLPFQNEFQLFLTKQKTFLDMQNPQFNKYQQDESQVQVLVLLFSSFQTPSGW